VGIGFQGPIVVGKFVDKPRPTFQEMMNDQLGRTLAAKYAAHESHAGGDNVRS